MARRDKVDASGPEVNIQTDYLFYRVFVRGSFIKIRGDHSQLLECFFSAHFMYKLNKLNNYYETSLFVRTFVCVCD